MHALKVISGTWTNTGVAKDEGNRYCNSTNMAEGVSSHFSVPSAIPV